MKNIFKKKQNDIEEPSNNEESNIVSTENETNEKVSVNDIDVNDSIEKAKNNPRVLQLSKASVIIAIAVVLVLIIAAIVLAYTLPVGQYERAVDADGNEYISGPYHEDSSLQRIAWWKVILSPILVLGANGALTLWAILILLVVIGAVFNALEKTGILIYMVESIRNKFGSKRYVLLFLLTFMFMFMGTTVGACEEIIPLIPIAVLLSYGLGWDAFIGLGISMLAANVGFMAGVVNPFNVGIAQTIVGLPMYSGIGLRVLTFVLGYIIIMAFMFIHAKRIDKDPTKSYVYKEDLIRKQGYDFENATFVRDPGKDKALKFFGGAIIFIIFCAILSIFLQGEYIPALGDFALGDYILYITVAVYVVAGIVACIYSGLKGKELLKTMGKGALTLLPATAMVLIASGVRYIMEEGNVMDTVLYYVISASEGKDHAALIVIIYLAVIVFEVFVPSGSAKAFLLMPMIGEICSQLGIDMQVAVLAFAFGDGIVNSFLPISAALLLELGLTTVTYPKWFKWAGPIIALLFLMTIGILMLGQFVIYA